MQNSFLFSRIASRTGFAALGLLSLGLTAVPAAATPVQAPTTINFDNLVASDSAATVASPYTQQGFTFSAPSGFIATGADNSNGDGETSLYSRASTRLTQSNGQAFDFNAIDLGPLLGNIEGNLNGGPVLFTGTLVGGKTVTDTKTITSGTYQTFAFTGFTGLQSLTFGPASSSTTAPLFDNVVVTGTPAAVAPVPEASTVVSLGLMLALGGLAFAAKRRKSAAA